MLLLYNRWAPEPESTNRNFHKGTINVPPLLSSYCYTAACFGVNPLPDERVFIFISRLVMSPVETVQQEVSSTVLPALHLNNDST